MAFGCRADGVGDSVEVAPLMGDVHRYVIVYFALFGVLLLASGLWLFGMKAGFGVETIAEYYLGNEALLKPPKSREGLLEIAVPHLGGMGLFIMVSAHFVLFTSQRSRRLMVWVAALCFIGALLAIASPFAIIAGWGVFAGVKLAAMVLFQITGLFLLWTVCYAAVMSLRESF